MVPGTLVIAIVVGVVQGVLEWLPVSSEGGVAIALTVAGFTPERAVGLALFLHVGTALAATAYYRADLVELSAAARARERRPDLGFLVVATLVSVAIAALSYWFLLEAVTQLAGGAFVALIGGLLVGTGLVQRVAGGSLGERNLPDGLDAVLVGAGQGVAILPGVSRSGTTTSLLLLRGHDGESAFRLSFLLSIPASLGAGALALVAAGGLPGIDPLGAAVALVVSAVVGYAAIGMLLGIVRRLSFWAVAVGLGVLAILGGVAVGV